MSNVEIGKMNNEVVNKADFSHEDILLILKQLSNSDNLIRNKAEEYLTLLKFELKLYQILFNIFKSDNIEKYYKIQSLLIVKNLIRLEINSNKTRHRINLNENETYKEFNLIIEYLQNELVEVINLGKYDEIYKSHLKELILLVADKKYPANWENLNLIFSKIYEMQVEQIIIDETTFSMIYNLNLLFYSLIKQTNKKRIPQTRVKFLQFKSFFLNMFCGFYEKTLNFFERNSNLFNNLEFISKFLSLMGVNDKILLILIDSCFNISDFHKDEKLMLMIKTILDRTVRILSQVTTYENEIKEWKELLSKNLYKNLKNLAKIQCSSPVVLYRDLDTYVKILIHIINNCNSLTQDIVKVTFFGLFKVINTVSYKEQSEEYGQRKLSGPTNLSASFSDKTPEKPKRSVTYLVSPSKFKNFEAELKEANDTFSMCFKEENIRSLIESLLRKAPLIFKKENENIELELLAEMEDELLINDAFSTNTMSWQMLYKNLLEALIINFPEVSVKYIKDILEILYISSFNEEITTNIFFVDSFISFVNLLPNLYKNNIISEIDMIDSNKFIAYLESLLNKSEIIMKKYIVTISKWCDVLISLDTIFNYVDNIIYFLTNSNNNVILLECCLALKNIISQIDKYLKKDLQCLNVHVDRRKLEENLKIRINWSSVLTIVSNVCLEFISTIKSAELLLSLINLFTCLIQKCHYQCDGKIVNTIQNSKLTQIILDLNDEFAQHAFIEMWKCLLISFCNSSIIVDLTLQFISISFKKEINMNNLGLLLFLLRIIDQTDEIRTLLISFLKDHLIIFHTTQKQYLSIILFNVLEELCLFDIFDLNDIGNILKLCQDKYLPLFELSKELRLKQLMEEKANQLEINNQKKNDEFIYQDLAEYKSSIIGFVNSAYTYYLNFKNMDISEHIRMFLMIIIEEVSISKDGPSSLFSTGFLSTTVPLLNRISIIQFEFFKSNLNEFLNKKKISFEQFLPIWINRMQQMTSIETRKLNVLTVCKLLPLLDKICFLKNLNEIFHICLITVHSEMMKKLDPDLHIKQRTNTLSNKSINIKSSIRKKILFEQDVLLNIDLHNLFVENFKVALMHVGISYEELIQNIIENYGLVSMMNQILGIVPIEK